MAVLAPMPMASVRTATSVKPGAWERLRIVYRMSLIMSLIDAKRSHWIQVRRPPRWQQRRRHRDADEDGASRGEGREISHLNSEDQCTERARQRVTKNAADHNARDRKPETVGSDEAYELVWRRAKRQADANLVRAPRYAVRHDPVQPERRQAECKDSESTEQCADPALLVGAI